MVLMALASPLTARAAPSVLQQTAPASDVAIQRIGDCVADRNHLLVSMLIDESASLKETDPLAQRVTAIRAGLDALHDLALVERDGVRPTVEVRFASFSARYSPLGDWSELDSEDLFTFLSEGARSFADRDDGIDTDYVSALQGVKADMDARAREVTDDGERDTPCRLVMWFTDGQFDIDDRVNAGQVEEFGRTKPWAEDIALDADGAGDRAVERGRGVLCGGPGVDEALTTTLRRDEIEVLAIALTSDIEAEDQTFLQSIAEGRSAGGTCGEVSEDAPGGAYLGAESLSDLIEAFYNAIQESGGGTDSPGSDDQSVCVGPASPECQRTFTLEAGLRRFTLLALTGDAGVNVELRGPSESQPLVLEPEARGQQTYSGADLEWNWLAPDAAAVSGRLPQDQTQWAGEWSVAFVDPDGSSQGMPSRSQIFLFGNLRPEVPEDASVVLGSPTTIPVRAVPEEGSPPTDEDFFDQVTLDATIAVPGGQPHDVEVRPGATARDFAVAYTPPPALAARKIELTTTLRVTLPSGLELAPVVRTFDVPVEVPPDQPRIEEDELTPPSIGGDDGESGDSTSDTLTVVGSDISDGCVWIEGFELTSAPSEVTGVDVTTTPDASSKDDCVRVERGASQELTVELTPQGSGEGLVEGVLHVRTFSERSGDENSVELPVRFQMVIPPGGDVWWKAVALLIAGILVPLIGLWLLKWRSGRYPDRSTLYCYRAEIEVDVIAGTVREGGQVFALSERRIRPFDGEKDRDSEFSGEGLEFDTSVGLNPFTQALGRVVAVGKRVVVGDSGAHTVITSRDGFGKSGRPERATVPLELRGIWIFTTSPDQLLAVRSHVVDDVQADPSQARAPVYGQAEAAAPGAAPSVVAGTFVVFVDETADKENMLAVTQQVNDDLADAVRRLVEGEPVPAAEPEPPSNNGGVPSSGAPPYGSGPASPYDPPPSPYDAPPSPYDDPVSPYGDPPSPPHTSPTHDTPDVVEGPATASPDETVVLDRDTLPPEPPAPDPGERPPAY